MCGFVGVLNANTLTEQSAKMDLALNYIAHRGPDDRSQIQIDFETSAVTFGHRRLSIQDLSEHGAQPMWSKEERYVIIYNGEIYNFMKLKEELEAKGEKFRGHSDTEIFLTILENEGIEAALKKIKGMYAMAIVDRKDKKLYLCRDLTGEKPLYYGVYEGQLLFGSELKAFKPFIAKRPTINQDAIKAYLEKCYIPTPHCIFEEFHKLLPGSYISFDLEDEKFLKPIDAYADPIRFWKAEDALTIDKKYEESSEELLDELEEVITDVIREQMISDVPHGAFLSGGIDSSLVVSLMQKVSDRPVKTFSIGFHEKEYNEANHAKAIAEHLGTDHTELYLKADDLLELVPEICRIWDEPFADSSQIPTWYVARLAKKDVTVCLSGDGGDEVFGGYNRHFYLPKILSKFDGRPDFLKKMVGEGLTFLTPLQIDKLYNLIPTGGNKIRSLGDKVYQVGKILNSKTFQEAYDQITSQIYPGESLMKNKDVNAPKEWFDKDKLAKLHLSEQTMAQDFLTYMMDDILVKVDRACMANSLEGRIPFLDQRVVEFAAKMSVKTKIEGTSGKICLKKILSRHVPKDLYERPKSGFGIPIEKWLRGPLKEWAGSLINKDLLESQGVFDVKAVHRLWDEHQSDKANHQYRIWNILMFQEWYQKEYLTYGE